MIYLDTHVLAWLYSGDSSKLSTLAAEQIRNDDTVISPMVVLELQYLYDIGRARSPASTVFEAMSKAIGLSVCRLPFPVVVDHALRERWTRDPFDRLIVAQARANNAPLLTKDERIRRHYKHAIW